MYICVFIFFYADISQVSLKLYCSFSVQLVGRITENSFLCVDNDLITLDYVVAVQPLVGELHLFGTRHRTHMLVHVEYSHAVRRYAGKLLELLFELIYSLVHIQSVPFTLVATHYRHWHFDLGRQVHADQRIEFAMNAHHFVVPETKMPPHCFFIQSVVDRPRRLSCTITSGVEVQSLPSASFSFCSFFFKKSL